MKLILLRCDYPLMYDLFKDHESEPATSIKSKLIMGLELPLQSKDRRYCEYKLGQLVKTQEKIIVQKNQPLTRSAMA